MADKPQLEIFQTPAGEAVFPWITKADVKHDSAGVYHTDLALTPELAEEFQAKLERVRDEFAASLPMAQQQSLKPRPVSKLEYTRPAFTADMTDQEKENLRHSFVPELTGRVLFRFKLKANVTPKSGDAFEQSPVVVSADTGKAIEEPVYGGSIIRVRGQIVPYTNAVAGEYGITLRMKAVQVVELQTGSSEGAGIWTDFDAEAA